MSNLSKVTNLLQVQAHGFEDILKSSPEDQASLEVCHLLLSTWMFKWLQFYKGEIATLVQAFETLVGILPHTLRWFHVGGWCPIR